MSLSARVSVPQATQEARSARIEALIAHLRADTFDAARYESTARLRAERIASILGRVLSRGQLRRRLRRLGVSPEFCGGELLALSVEGDGLDVRRADGQGQVLVGTGLDAQLLEVFPELLSATLRNLTVDLTLAGTASFSGVATSGAAVLQVSLALFLKSYLASGAVAHYKVNVGDTAMIPTTVWGTFTIADPFGSTTLPGGGPAVVLYANQPVSFAWSAAGLNWLEIHAQQGPISPGNLSFSTASLLNPTNPGAGAVCEAVKVVVTYTVPPCETCTLIIQANDGCDGGLVDGGEFELSNGMGCTTVNGTCTISGIPDGDYDWTFEGIGYDPITGSFQCECLVGGSTTLILAPVPVDGCGCQLCVTVLDPCTGEPLEGVLIDSGSDTCVTDEVGVCCLNVAAGEQTITASLEGYVGGGTVWDCVDGEGGEIEIGLFPEAGCGGPCGITGTIDESCFGGVLEGVTVLVDGVVWTVTGADGTYAISGLSAGLHEICYELAGYTTICEPFTCVG